MRSITRDFTPPRPPRSLRSLRRSTLPLQGRVSCGTVLAHIDSSLLLKERKTLRPLFFAGRGDSPIILLSFPPPNEGDGAPKGACPGFRRNGPDYAGRLGKRPSLTHQRRMRPRLSTRHRGICPLSRFSGAGRGGPVVARSTFAPAAARGHGCVGHARRYRIPPRQT